MDRYKKRRGVIIRADLQYYYSFEYPLTGEKIQELLLFLYNNMQTLKDQEDLANRVSQLEKIISESISSEIDGGTY